MQVGLIGAGSMATALARGWGEPVLVADPDRKRARALVDELGGESMPSNRELAARADLIVLCHKPAQLPAVAEEVGGVAGSVASILWGVTIAQLEDAFPGTPVHRLLPNIAVEARAGVLAYAPGALADANSARTVEELFGRLGRVVRLPEDQIDAAGAVMSCGPAFLALTAEALADAAAARGLDEGEARSMAVETMAGTASTLAAGGLDTADLRSRVASPGGVTAKGLDALERAGLRRAFDDAVAVVLGERG